MILSAARDVAEARLGTRFARLARFPMGREPANAAATTKRSTLSTRESRNDIEAERDPASPLAESLRIYHFSVFCAARPRVSATLKHGEV